MVLVHILMLCGWHCRGYCCCKIISDIWLVIQNFVSCINDAITGHNVFGLASFNPMELWSSPKPKSNWGLENVVHTMLHHVPKRWLGLALSPDCFATTAWYRDNPGTRLSGRDGDSLICCTQPIPAVHNMQHCCCYHEKLTSVEDAVLIDSQNQFVHSQPKMVISRCTSG